MVDLVNNANMVLTPSTELGDLATFGKVIAAAAHLPLIAVSDWGNRAAHAINAAGGTRATTVTIIDRQTRVVLHVGAGCSSAFSAIQSRLFATSASARYEDDFTPALSARYVDWHSPHSHPFAEAGLPAGRVIVASSASAGPVGLILRHWRQTEAATDSGSESELRAMDAIVGFISRAAQHLVPADHRPIEWLSSKESEVLDLITLGQTVREIAESLGRSPHTIHDHLKSIHRKTGLSTRGALVAAATGKPHTPIATPKPEPMQSSPVVQTHPAITLHPPGQSH